MSEHIVSRPELTAEKLRELLHYDPEIGIFTWKVRAANRVKVGNLAGCQNNEGYLQISVLSRIYQAHRLAWLYMYGVWPEDQIDHINRIRTDNRISNLREASNKQNNQNRSKQSNNTSGHTGVCWLKQDSKWRASIKHNQNHIHLGRFATLEEAVAARKAGELRYWGHHRAD